MPEDADTALQLEPFGERPLAAIQRGELIY
jgi:hypothetical protein